MTNDEDRAAKIPGPGYWLFQVEDHNGQYIRQVTQGESSRRGWAMDGADQSFPKVH